MVMTALQQEDLQTAPLVVTVLYIDQIQADGTRDTCCAAIQKGCCEGIRAAWKVYGVDSWFGSTLCWVSPCVYHPRGGWQYAYMHAGFDYHRIIIE